jgi:hypothetical protein
MGSLRQRRECRERLEDLDEARAAVWYGSDKTVDPSSHGGQSWNVLYPVHGGANVAGLDLLGTSVAVSGPNLVVTTKVADLSVPAATAAAVPGTRLLQYVTRWQLGNTIYYAAATDFTVKLADVGTPSAGSLLEEAGTYAFAASHPQGATTNAQALADDVPLQVDGACCFNASVGKKK